MTASHMSAAEGCTALCASQAVPGVMWSSVGFGGTLHVLVGTFPDGADHRRIVARYAHPDQIAAVATDMAIRWIEGVRP